MAEQDASTPQRSPEREVVKAVASPLGQLLVGSVPYLGGLSSAVAAVASERRFERIEEFVDGLKQEMISAAARGQIDEQYVSSPEFADEIAVLLEHVAATRDREKIEYLARYASAMARPQRPDQSWASLFRRYVGDLSGGHLVGLMAVFSVQRAVSERERYGTVEVPGTVPFAIDQLRSSFDSTTDAYVRVLVGDLVAMGLLHNWRGEPGSGAVVITETGRMFGLFLEGLWSAVSSV